jgi:uncharacterized protein YciI
MHYLLFYEKATDHAQREGPLMHAHRDHVRAALSRGEIVLAGPLLEPTDGSNVLLFQTETAAPAESFAAADPYVTGGIVSRWQVRPWQTVAGKHAACPLPDFQSSEPK